jgi:chromosome segregation ATPase
MTEEREKASTEALEALRAEISEERAISQNAIQESQVEKQKLTASIDELRSEFCCFVWLLTLACFADELKKAEKEVADLKVQLENALQEVVISKQELQNLKEQSDQKDKSIKELVAHSNHNLLISKSLKVFTKRWTKRITFCRNWRA